jgi:ribosomal-protein-alanine N-acetyltransferase
MNLSAVTPNDAVVLAGLHAQAFPHPWTAADMAEILDGPGAFGLIAADATPQGMVLARVIADEAEILTIAVSPGARRGGLGYALLQAAIGVARQMGAVALFLEVAVDNAAALALYTGSGFAPAGRRRGYYDRGLEGRVDALVLRRGLNSDAG